MCHYLLIHSIVNGKIDSFQFVDFVNNAAMTILVHEGVEHGGYKNWFCTAIPNAFQTISKVFVPISTPKKCENSRCFTSLQTLFPPL